MRQGAGRSLAPPGQGNTPAGDSSTLDVADLEETEDGFKIIICRSKTDQEAYVRDADLFRDAGAGLL
jgi:hypothetical protein